METVDDLACFYFDLIEALSLRRVSVLGHSFGGWIAAEMAVRCSHAVEKLVLVDAVGLRTLPTPVGPAGGSITDWLVLDAERLRALAWRDRETAQTLALPGDSNLSQDERIALLRSREAASRYGWKPFFFNPRLKYWLHRITTPTLVLWGEHDGIVPRSVGEAYVQGIPGARLEIVPETAHLPHLERPQYFADLVKRFLG
jgi:pimeloyl-ACP methyl ester carboxylesterase